MRASELRDLTDEELAAKERETCEALFRLQLRRGTNQLDSPAALRKTRRDLARLKTVLTERARAAGAKETA